MIHFLIFDAYGTLVELDDFFGRLHRGFQARGAVLPFEVVQKAAYAEMRYYIGNSSRARDDEGYAQVLGECVDVITAAMQQAGQHLPLTRDETADVLKESIRFRLFPETLPVLQELSSRGIPLGILSNWDYRLPEPLREAGILDFFSFVLTSSEAGHEKPAPQFFAAGLARARSTLPDLQAHDCLYVGDHYEKDVLGARASGMQPVWLVRDKRDIASGETHFAQDDVARLSTLSELLLHFE